MLKKRKNYFTIVELLVVLLIIGLMSAFVAPRLMNVGEDAKKDTTKAQLKSLKSSVEIYYMNNSVYPESLKVLADKGLLDGRSVPKDGWDRDFIYKIGDEQFGYDIISYGADGQTGGEGLNEDLSCFGKASE